MKDQHVQSSKNQVKSSQVRRVRAASRAVRAPTASSRGRRVRRTRPRATMGMRLWRALRTSRCSHGCSMPRGAGARPAASRRRSRREGQMSRSPRSSDKMVNDRAGHARHEGPVLPSWDVNEEPKYRTQLRAGFLTTSKDHELFDRGDYDPLFLSPNPPSLSLLDAGRSRADFLFVVRVALIGRDRPASTYLGAAK